MCIKHTQTLRVRVQGVTERGLRCLHFIWKAEVRNYERLAKPISGPLIVALDLLNVLWPEAPRTLLSGEHLCWPACLGFICLLTTLSWAGSLSHFS